MNLQSVINWLVALRSRRVFVSNSCALSELCERYLGFPGVLRERNYLNG